MPSPVPDRPGLLIRDPFQYSDVTMIVPPALVECLDCFDGQRTSLDLREILVRLTGDLRVGEIEEHLVGALRQAGFLEDDVFAAMRDRRQASFAEAAFREPSHAGSGYPAEPAALRAVMTRYMDGAGAPALRELIGLAAPHISPDLGARTYRAAYRAIGPEYKDRVFVILGTSHYGEPDRFGLTRKNFVTPFGQASTEVALVEELAAAGSAVKMEDYCHAIEHSIEFQVVFLQHVFGPDITILPVLCGPFARSLYGSGAPEDDEGVAKFFGALARIAEREAGRLFWVLGVDMAHMGRRYGDPFPAEANDGRMEEVERQDRRRIGCLLESDAAGFWEAVRENRDELKWCGSAPFYTFLRAVPGAKGELLGYEQSNIDEQSVVTFGALAFRR